MVRERLDKAFANLQSKTVQGCINTANKHLKELHRHILKMNDICDECSDDEEDDSTEELKESSSSESHDGDDC